MKFIFDVAGPNMCWTTDIKTKEGCLYLATVMDLYSKRIVGCSPTPTTAANMPVTIISNCFGSMAFICSMSRKGDCWDNSPTESFFKTLKTELVYHRHYKSRAEAKLEIFEYIEVSYTVSGCIQPLAMRVRQISRKTTRTRQKLLKLCPIKRGSPILY